MRDTTATKITIGGWPALQYADGRIRPIVQGGSDPDPTNPPAPDPQPTPPPAPSNVDPLEQLNSEIQRIAARETAAGARQATRALLEGTGFDSAEDLQAFVTAAREREQAQLTEAERREQQAQQRETAAAAREAAAAEREHSAAVRAALVDAGVGAQIEDPAARQARRDAVSRLLDVEIGADEPTIAAAIENVRTTMPELFGTVEQPPTPPHAPSGLPRGPAPRQQPQNTGDRIDEIKAGIAARTGVK